MSSDIISFLMKKWTYSPKRGRIVAYLAMLLICDLSKSE